MIKLGNDYRINADANGYTLVRTVPIRADETTKARLAGMGKTLTNTHKDVIAGYYSTLEEALTGYARSATRHRVEYNALELKDVKQLIKELKDEISAYRCSHE